MMHKFSKTGEYAKKRLKIALAEDRNTISASDNMAQIKKEIKSVIKRHMNINDEAYEVRIIMRDKNQLITFNKIPFDHHVISIRIKITKITDRK